ncbi:MAG: flagellar hook-basal body complex protein [Eubacteriales bacterium]|nr:flagellar hook-basal body complex protein [Eubacteriales bacterium]MDD4421740.1 flagellar hook-basal body complex protein [Eubacteriales bacterium]HBR31050.1 flagellar basal body rod protein FlgG [Clostridiales bacterium]
MIKSMYSAVTGLRNHQTMLDVIGNNIANVNTTGFKSSSVLFTDLYYQTLSAESAATATSGGSEINQIGYGSTLSSIEINTSRSGYKQTGSTLDMYISGEGYFVVQDATSDILYTRVGSFEFNSDGSLVDSNGNFVLGVMEGALTDDLTKLTITDFSDYTGLSISERGTITGTNSVTNTIDVLGSVMLAVFANPSGLSQEGNMNYKESSSSGVPLITNAGSSITGTLISGGLEMSNVDLTKEFTDMIIAQRGFQANSRVITTSDQVLEELVNIKR